MRKLSMSELGRMNAEAYRESGKFPIILILDNIRSGLNVGSIFRSSDAFRISKIYCCGYTCVPPHREVLKSALGSTETVDWEYAPDGAALVRELTQNGIATYAIEQTDKSVALEEFVPGEGPTAFVLGNEVSGVSEEILAGCKGAIEITQHGTKHSLNVAVCAGIVLFGLTGKLKNPIQ